MATYRRGLSSKNREDAISSPLPSLTDIAVVIVTFNSERVIGDALRSLPEGVETLVVDNASTDGSIRISEEAGVRVNRNSQNIGFGSACNIGASLTEKPYILFFNPDAELLSDALESLLHTLASYPDAGAAAPSLLSHNGEETWRYKSLLHPYPSDAPRPATPVATCCVPLLTGAAILCRREAFETAGQFDENIFLYFEDDDLSRRMTEAGYSLLHVPEAKVQHDFGRSSIRSMQVTRFKYKQRLLSQSYVCQKYELPFNPKHVKTKSLKRLLIAILKADKLRIAAAMGQLDALKEIAGTHNKKTLSKPQ